MRRALVSFFNFLALLLMAPCAATVNLASWIGFGGTELFRFWAQCVAILPGLPGAYIRRAYYRMTLDYCSPTCHVGYGALFSHRDARVEHGVYVGNYTLCGKVRLREGSLIGSRASLLSGHNQHQFSKNGRWLASNLDDFTQIEVGEYAWIGEAAVIMANVGKGTAVAAGSVVSAVLPEYVVVAGNPARFVRKLEVIDEADTQKGIKGSIPSDPIDGYNGDAHI